MFTKDMENMNHSKKQRKGKLKIVAGCILGVIIIGAAVVILPKVLKPDGGKVTTITESTLEKVLEISDLSTLDYTYNSITNVMDEDGETVKYHVAYEGVVTAGIDFEQVDISVDEVMKKIVVTIPETEIQNIDINMSTMEFMFEKNKYETETVSQEAYKACCEDLERKATEESELLSMAKDNAVDAVTALIIPWVEQIDEEYTVEVK